MALVILSDSDAATLNFWRSNSEHRTSSSEKNVISGFTVNLRLVEPFGVYALICFQHKTMSQGSGGTGSLGILRNLFWQP